MTNETKVCPFCGEEILAVAKKCKHCGEWLDKQQEEAPQVKQCEACGEDIPANATICEHCGESVNNTTTPTNSSTDKFANIDVNDKWKKRFEAIDKQIIDGNCLKYQPEFKTMPIKERFKIAKVIYLSDIPSSLAMLFGVLYYLVKGMWLKCIVYSIIICILTLLMPILFGYLLLIMWLYTPYDYYRYKVLGKQW